MNDAMALMRALLLVGGMVVDAALEFTLHSWRHLLPTAALQVRLSGSDQVEIGHWAAGPAMHDSAACVAELTAKSAILGGHDTNGKLTREARGLHAPLRHVQIPCDDTWPPMALSRKPICSNRTALNAFIPEGWAYTARMGMGG